MLCLKVMNITSCVLWCFIFSNYLSARHSIMNTHCFLSIVILVNGSACAVCRHEPLEKRKTQFVFLISPQISSSAAVSALLVEENGQISLINAAHRRSTSPQHVEKITISFIYVFKHGGFSPNTEQT